jgi:3'(2'), 5'-bisphosphate nucleotidase
MAGYVTGRMLASDSLVALDVAEAAAVLLLETRATALAANWSPERTRSTGDRVAHELIVERLAALRPDDAVLSEEGVDDPVRLSAARVWIVDPLDGTREFGEPDRDDWAVHIALAVDGVARTGVVALPARGESFESSTVAAVAVPEGPPRLLVSRSRPPAEAEAVAAALGATIVAMGSAGAKTAAVLRGEAGLYLHAGGQYEWDLAAPVAVALGAGLHATRLDGSPFQFNQRNPYVPDALIGHPELARRAIAALAR